MDRVFPHSDDTRVGSIFFRCSEFVCFELVVLQSGLHGKVAAKLITYIGYGAAAIEFRTQRGAKTTVGMGSRQENKSLQKSKSLGSSK